jgi:hypothetical protein
MAADADCSGRVNIGDVANIVGYIFMGGNPPCSDCP